MAKRKQTDTKQLYEEAIRQNIAKKDWDKLSEVMIGAEQVGVSKIFRKKGWCQVALFEAEKGNHPAAIIAFNAVRGLDPTARGPIDNLYSEVEAFVKDFEGKFCRQDLVFLEQAVERIKTFHSVHSKSSATIRERGERLAQWIKSQKANAPVKPESPATHHVERIFAALYPPMTIEEVRAEFARIVAPAIRRRVEQKAQGSTGGGNKGPKEPEDEETPEELPSKKSGKKKKPTGGSEPTPT